MLLWAVPIYFLQAQTLEWTQLYEVHSEGFGADITPNSIKKNDGAIITVVVENEILKLYKTFENGTIADVLSSEVAFGEYTPLIEIGENEQAIVFKLQGVSNTFKLLQTDSDLNVTRDFQLDFPIALAGKRILNLISHNGSLYLTLFAGSGSSTHYLFRINPDNTLTLVHSENVGIPYGEDIIVLDNNSVVFSFKQANQHIVRCVSLSNGTVLWERNAHQNYGIPLQYKVLKNNNTLFTFALERLWVDGAAIDALALKHIDATSGTILYETSVVLPNTENCAITFYDFAYNPVNNHLYICYQSCFEELSFSVVELDIEAENIIAQNYFPYSEDIELPVIGERADLHIMPNGRIVLIYKNYKNSVEKSNLYISPLDENLEKSGTVEIHFSSKNSSEFNTHILSYDNDRILVAGIVPDPNPFIFWEQVSYFTAMIYLDAPLSVENPAWESSQIMLYPNPAENTVNITVPEDISELIIFDVTGKIMNKYNVNQQVSELDISKYSAGIYFINFSGKKNNHTKKLVVK